MEHAVGRSVLKARMKEQLTRGLKTEQKQAWIEAGIANGERRR
jgi:hypothetical protein